MLGGPRLRPLAGGPGSALMPRNVGEGGDTFQVLRDFNPKAPLLAGGKGRRRLSEGLQLSPSSHCTKP